MRRNAEELAKMRRAGRVVAEMQQSQHSTGRELSTVLTYLRDVDDAKTRKVSVIAQRDYRLAEAKKAQAEAEARRRKASQPVRIAHVEPHAD